MRTSLTGGMLVLGAVAAMSGPAQAAGEFIWPTTGWLSSTHRYSNGAYHSGSADIATGYWSWILASRQGYAYAYWQGGGCGNYSYLVHSGGYRTNYCHQVRWPLAGGGRWVGRGQLIGYVGSTGWSTGPHVHYTIFRWGVRQVIPYIWIGKWVYRGYWVPGNWWGMSW